MDLGDNNPIQFHFEARYPKEVESCKIIFRRSTDFVHKISANICIIKRPSGSSDRVEALLDGEVLNFISQSHHRL